MLARTIRVAFDPWSRPGLARLAAADGERDGIDEAAAWPVATEASWGAYRADGAVHATYWIAGWPRTDVGAAFLSPLLLHAQVVRAVGVTIEPISPIRAIREVEASRTSDLADEELRGRMGFMETARRRRVADATTRREEELADGHAAVRFAGYVTVSARSFDELEHHCSEVEHAAQMARLELLRLYAPAGAGIHVHASALPGTAVKTNGQPGHRTTTAHIQAAYPFVAEGGLGGRGVYVGRDVYGGSFCYDPWELYGRELTSPNAVVIGIVGRAKSSLVKTYVFRQSVFGRQAWIVDVKGEYDRLAEAMGVRPIALSPGGSVRLNPLTPRGGPERQLNLLYSVAAAALERPLTPEEKRAAQEALHVLERRSDGEPTLPGAVDVLIHPPEEMAEALAMTLEELAVAYPPDGLRARSALLREPARDVRRPDDAGPRSRRAARRPQPARRPEHADRLLSASS